MNQFARVMATVVGLGMSNMTTFYLGYDMASNECTACRLNIIESLQK